MNIKQRSIGITLKTRYWSTIIFYISIIVYGVTAISMYGKTDIGIGYSGLIIVASMIALCSMTVKCETILKYADPLNKDNQKRYIFIILVELLEMLSVYILCVNISEDERILVAILYFAVVSIIFYFLSQIHKKIYYDYEIAMDNNLINDLIIEYDLKNNSNVDIDWYFMRFVYFMLYLLSLIFIYKYTLHSWIFSIAFIILSIFVMWKLHWIGIVKFVKNKKLYFGIISIISSIGIIFLKLVYDGIIALNLFKNRDEYEYLMVLILFYIPIIYYGKRVSEVYIRSKFRWTP